METLDSSVDSSSYGVYDGEEEEDKEEEEERKEEISRFRSYRDSGNVFFFYSLSCRIAGPELTD